MQQCWKTHHEAHHHQSSYVSWKSVFARQLNLLRLKQKHNLSGQDKNAHTPSHTNRGVKKALDIKIPHSGLLKSGILG